MLNQDWKEYLEDNVQGQHVELWFCSNMPGPEPLFDEITNFLNQFQSNTIIVIGDDMEDKKLNIITSKWLEKVINEKTIALEIRRCNLRDSSFAFLKKSTSLRSLELICNKITDEGSITIINNLKENKFLTSISLKDNKISDACLNEMSANLGLYSSLLNLYILNLELTGNPCMQAQGSIGMSSIKKRIEENRKLITKKLKKATKTEKNNELILNFLQNYGYDITGKYGETVLHWAAFHGNDSLVKQLCGLGVDINKQDEQDKGPP